MFLKKLFAKPYGYYKDRGDRNFAEERFAEARTFYLEALERVGECADPQQEETYLRGVLAQAGYSLANLNMIEAEAAIRQSDFSKAHDHLTLALELAEDVVLREKAEKLMKDMDDAENNSEQLITSKATHGCAGCGHDHSSDSNKSAPAEGQLPSSEQFQLLIHTLPGDLPSRYVLMGEEFAYAYMKSHFGDQVSALEVYERLLAENENDILLYETAITRFQLGNVDVCEQLLIRAIGLNGSNPLCNLSLAQLCISEGRHAEAVTRLQQMRANNILPDQALMMLGEVYELQGDDDSAFQIFSQALNVPSLKRVAAERLLPILNRQGRTEEIQYLQRNYLKGCC